MKAAALSASIEHYEALRQNAVARERIFSADPLGAVLVVKTGVAGWMQRWSEAAGARARPAPVPALPNPKGCDDPGWQHELTLVLAQMAVRHLSVSTF